MNVVKKSRFIVATKDCATLVFLKELKFALALVSLSCPYIFDRESSSRRMILSMFTSFENERNKLEHLRERQKLSE